jgi:ABC-type multidrug transport system fused ATPase/permease subunit
LLRLVEPSLTEEESDYAPPILIDDVDILRIGLRDLRSRVGIIPQNPVLFSGTIRGNIDIFDQFSDEEIWAALDKCGLLKAVQEMPGELNAQVSEGGENLSCGKLSEMPRSLNKCGHWSKDRCLTALLFPFPSFSAGMRQMLVLGRALLRQCRVLLLDEATSNVDFETDKAIQKTLLESFPGVTVITIAHRVNTILHSDKILVMKDGLVCEFGPPNDLLADPSSTFSDIARHAEAENE